MFKPDLDGDVKKLSKIFDLASVSNVNLPSSIQELIASSLPLAFFLRGPVSW